MKKRIAIFLTMVMFIFVLSGCISTLPDSFNKAEVTKKVEEIIEMTYADNYEAIMAEGDEVFTSQITVDQLRDSVNPMLEKAGAFEEITKTVVGGDETTDNGEVAVAVAIVQGTEGRLTFTINMNSELKIIGYFIK